MKNELTATGLVLNKQKDKILLVHHKKFNKWLPPGGHVEPNELTHVAALREVKEETGVTARIIDCSPKLFDSNEVEKQLPVPLIISHQKIPTSKKEPEHMHVDFLYLMYVSGESKLVHAEKEVSQVSWFTAQQIKNLNTFQSIKMICPKVLSYFQKNVDIARLGSNTLGMPVL